MLSNSFEKAKDLAEFVHDSLSTIYDDDEARAIALSLLRDEFDIEMTDVVKNSLLNFEKDQWNWLEQILKRLTNQEPLQYIVGYAWFGGEKYEVNENVLIPRQETEELADLIVKENRDGGLAVLDIGTGTGCLPIYIAQHAVDCEVHACDYDSTIVEIARRNANQIGVEVEFYICDILKSFPVQKKLDIIVSNPPYVPLQEKSELEKNVAEFEPEEALYVPDDDPLVFYRKIAQWGTQKLKPKGRLYFEIHEEKGQAVQELLFKMKYEEIRVVQDLNGKERIVSAIYR